ncbi:hypothetical protein PsorP6_001657 [Peronosclerospora sorghi]|uniref:Uncharacterized protein n=1 Tax=Peronosclerospora sorghi TaxID=230839 RepID=A0ACC0WYI0_9STRA|nr:hypothetical protein PsorP6_001657 [Peronosclerospora sorghi]
MITKSMDAGATPASSSSTMSHTKARHRKRNSVCTKIADLRMHVGTRGEDGKDRTAVPTSQLQDFHDLTIRSTNFRKFLDEIVTWLIHFA